MTYKLCFQLFYEVCIQLVNAFNFIHNCLLLIMPQKSYSYRVFMFRGQRNRNFGQICVLCRFCVSVSLFSYFTFSFMMKRKWEIITKIMLRYAGKFGKIGSRCAKTKDLRHKLAPAFNASKQQINYNMQQPSLSSTQAHSLC